MKNKTNLKSAVIGIIILIVILIIGSYTGMNYFENDADNKTNLYKNIGINPEELNILYLNVGQRR